MKQLLTLLLIATTLSCSKSNEQALTLTPQQPTGIFANSNVTFEDYTHGQTCSGANCYLHLDIKLSNVNGISKMDLVNSTSQVVYTLNSPVNGNNRMYHFQNPASGGTTIHYYSLKFTRTDNTTFSTSQFTVPK